MGDLISFEQPILGEEERAIGGFSVFTDRHLLLIEGQQLLYYEGFSLMDSSCCGPTGCGYVLVAGFIQDTKHFVEEAPTVLIELIVGELLQKQLRVRLMGKHSVNQVLFFEEHL